MFWKVDGLEFFSLVHCTMAAASDRASELTLAKLQGTMINVVWLNYKALDLASQQPFTGLKGHF
jgi:hypothetical protein